MLDKIKGGLIGFAIGDAMGVTTEFMSAEDIKKELGMVTDIVGGGVFGFEPGETSDDTAMTLAVAKGIITNSADPIKAIGRQFLKWEASNPKDIGITVAASFRNYQGDWFEAAELTHTQLRQSGGNGTLMRCMPIALAYSDIKKIEELSILQSKMTHQEDSASLACVIYNHIARRVLYGEDLKTAILAEIKNTTYDIDYRKEPDCSPSGYVVDTLKWVLYWLLNRDSFRDVIIGAVNMGGDSDTIAAIAGGLKGLEVGYSHLDYKYLNQLQERNVLEEIAEIIYEIRDKDTFVIKENQANYLQEIVHLTTHYYELAEQGVRFDESEKMMNQLKEQIYLYRASLTEAEADFEKKYNKWWNVSARFRRSRRLLDLGAPAIIIQNELHWLKTEADHLNQIHQGIEPQYTSEEWEELESLRDFEREMEEERKNQRYIE